MKPICVQKFFLRNLLALSMDDINKYGGENSGIGYRVGGVGLVRVQGTKDVNWVYVRSNDIKLEKCPRHKNSYMSLERVHTGTQRNVMGALFLKCNETVKIVEGTPIGCGYNVYFLYELAKLQRELKLPENERPFMFEDTKKKQVEAARAPRDV